MVLRNLLSLLMRDITDIRLTKLRKLAVLVIPGFSGVLPKEQCLTLSLILFGKLSNLG